MAKASEQEQRDAIARWIEEAKSLGIQVRWADEDIVVLGVVKGQATDFQTTDSSRQTAE